jgi:lysophospholipase L1-like esterase
MLSLKIKRGILYGLYLLAFTLIAAEILLRIYNPFPSSIVGDKITLNRDYSKVFINRVFPGTLDERIIYKRNRIGFRGPEPPADFKNHLTVIAIGGSTTECMYISEGKTWEDHVQQRLNDHLNNAWVNNAGFEGHSTFGHIILLRDYVSELRPNICLFLIGANDIDRKDLQAYDRNFTKSNQNWVLFLARHSQLVNTMLNLWRNHLAKEKNVTHNISFSLLNQQPIKLPDSTIQLRLSSQIPLLKEYHQRLNELIRLCRSNRIEPVFITQPSLMGNATDSISGVDLATFPIGKMNGGLFWQLLELYNQETKKSAAESGLLLIDLAHELPKNSAYYYDAIHYNNKGNIKVGEIISDRMLPWLKRRFPQYSRGD